LLLAFELIYFLVVKAKIKKLFAAIKAVARAIRKILPLLILFMPTPHHPFSGVPCGHELLAPIRPTEPGNKTKKKQSKGKAGTHEPTHKGLSRSSPAGFAKNFYFLLFIF
jgi:hypothetical protein